MQTQYTARSIWSVANYQLRSVLAGATLAAPVQADRPPHRSTKGDPLAALGAHHLSKAKPSDEISGLLPETVLEMKVMRTWK